MKKKLFFGFAVLAIAAVGTFTMNVNSNDYGLSDISLANVEVLAQSENGSGCDACAEFDTYGGSDNITTLTCFKSCTEEWTGIICRRWGC